MIEKIVLDFLKEKMSVPVYMERPEKAPSMYLVLQKTGSGEKDMIQRATMLIQSYAPTKTKAAQLNETMKEAIKDIADQNPVCSVNLNTDYEYTDTTKKGYRYQAVYEFYYY